MKDIQLIHIQNISDHDLLWWTQSDKMEINNENHQLIIAVDLIFSP